MARHLPYGREYLASVAGVEIDAFASHRDHERVGRGGGRVETDQIELGGAATIEEVEVEHIRRVLVKTPNLDTAAKSLGIDPSTLFRKRKKYGI